MVSGEPLHHFVREGIVDMRRNGLDPGLGLVDREFNNVMVIRTFGEMDVEFLMPMIKRSKIKKMIRKFHRGKGGQSRTLHHAFAQIRFGDVPRRHMQKGKLRRL